MLTDAPPCKANHHAGFLESDRIKNLRPAAGRAFTNHFTIHRMGNEATSSKHGRNGLNNLQTSFGRHAHGFKPAADIYLSMGFATEVPGGWKCGGGQIPLDDRELLICTLDYKPMNRILADDPANFALEFLQTRHASSVERWLGKPSIAASQFGGSATGDAPIREDRRLIITSHTNRSAATNGCVRGIVRQQAY